DAGLVSRIVQTIAPSWYTQIISVTNHESASPAPMPPDPGRMKREISALLQEISRERAVVLFLDDLHWVDASSVDVIAYLLDRPEVARVLIVGRYRPREIQGVRHFLDLRLNCTTRGLSTDIALHSLSRQEVERFVALSLPGHSLPPDAVSLIY